MVDLGWTGGHSWSSVPTPAPPQLASSEAVLMGIKMGATLASRVSDGKEGQPVRGGARGVQMPPVVPGVSCLGAIAEPPPPPQTLSSQ